jgi:hypothetical protein
MSMTGMLFADWAKASTNLHCPASRIDPTESYASGMSQRHEVISRGIVPLLLGISASRGIVAWCTEPLMTRSALVQGALWLIKYLKNI